MKKYEIELSFRFTDGAEKIIGECDTIEEAKTLCEKYITEIFKVKEELKDLGETSGETTIHVFAIPGVRFFVKKRSHG